MTSRPRLDCPLFSPQPLSVSQLFFSSSLLLCVFFEMIWGEEGNKHSELGRRCRRERHTGKQEPEGQHAGTEED